MYYEILPGSLFVRLNFLLFGFIMMSPFNFVSSILYHFAQLYPSHNIPFLVNVPANVGVVLSNIATYFLIQKSSFKTRIFMLSPVSAPITNLFNPRQLLSSFWNSSACRISLT